jgi:hypothetical protein
MTDQLTQHDWQRAVQLALDNLTPGVATTLAYDPRHPDRVVIHVRTAGGGRVPVLLRWLDDGHLAVQVGPRGKPARREATREGLRNAVTFGVLEAMIRASASHGGAAAGKGAAPKPPVARGPSGPRKAR